MKRLVPRLTYANVVATLALFLVLAGGSALAANQLAKNSVGTKQLKNNAVTTAKIKNGAVTGAKVQVSSLGTVPSATTADSARTADSAKTADSARTADSATNAAHAASADDASALDGRPASAFAEATTLVPIAPTLENDWIPVPEFGNPGYAKDAFGIVHLFGTVVHSGADRRQGQGRRRTRTNVFSLVISASIAQGALRHRRWDGCLVRDTELRPRHLGLA